MPPLYPLTFEPALLSKVWGGDRLARFGKKVAAGATIGESWEIADLASTSASGAGGGAVRSVIASGALKGRTLNDAAKEWGDALMGGSPLTADGHFPLLVKFLDAREDLSVQVHPSPAYAAAHEGSHLKTECWYILDAAPGAKLYKGVKAGVTREGFAAALRAGGAGVVEMLEAVPAVVGECHNLPSGTVHALGAGVLVAEVQTPSDTTFRVYDWGRAGRELHVEAALECIEFGPAPVPVDMRKNPPLGGVLTTEFFRVWRVACANEEDVPVGHSLGCFAVIPLKGSGSLFSDEGRFAPVDLVAGRTVLVPAGVAGDACIRPAEEARLECLIAALPVA